LKGEHEVLKGEHEVLKVEHNRSNYREKVLEPYVHRDHQTRAQLKETQDQLKETQDQLKETQDQLKETQGNLRAIGETLSWRVTRPLRGVRRVLSILGLQIRSKR
jgi:hypothetical protein